MNRVIENIKNLSQGEADAMAVVLGISISVLIGLAAFLLGYIILPIFLLSLAGMSMVVVVQTVSTAVASLISSHLAAFLRTTPSSYLRLGGLAIATIAIVGSLFIAAPLGLSVLSAFSIILVIQIALFAEASLTISLLLPPPPPPRPILVTRGNLDEFRLSDEFRFLIGEPTREIALTSQMTEEEFNAMELSTAEITILKSQRLPLSDENIRHLERSTDAVVVAKLREYKNLLRLETDLCSILFDRPERQDTILLVKQYKNGSIWLPVPGVADIFDKNSLKTWFVSSPENPTIAVHPKNRDRIKLPSPHTVGTVNYRTRYVFHPYYPADEDSGLGLSQEINQLSEELRGFLEVPAAEPTLDHQVATLRV